MSSLCIWGTQLNQVTVPSATITIVEPRIYLNAVVFPYYLPGVRTATGRSPVVKSRGRFIHVLLEHLLIYSQTVDLKQNKASLHWQR